MCQIKYLDVTEPSSWPAAVSDFLDQHWETFRGWECTCCSHGADAAIYDAAVEAFRDILRPFSLYGYHCTRLTSEEVYHVRAEGLDLPGPLMLNARIDSLVTQSVISTTIAELLKGRNQAGDTSRSGRIWFTFFVPRLEEQCGIERFFRSWGGEALYNCHEDDPQTGPVLRAIGSPCVVEALVPISSLARWKYPDDGIVRADLLRRGHRIGNELEHEGYSSAPIGADRILQITSHPSPRFADLTGCDGWKPALG